MADVQAGRQFLPGTDLGIAVLEPIFAPMDTLAHALVFMLYELLAHPDLPESPRAKADAVSAEGMPQARDVQPPRDERRHPGAYLHCGVGTHRCIGSGLGEFVALVAAATLQHDDKV